ncbi:hypothetical protein CMI43_02615 [Candidatus Pacearchaeota archaeon]|nr:hypothetical protein [Candidatus Pacearchaeota archaeon]|tara:strand:+ start:1519 stop:2229 length:711 start_codon:yes stop_codon:yes gene_type:complete
MNKKAEEGGTGISGKLVALILMIAVVFVAYYLIASYYSSDPLGIFPDYILDENVVQYDGRQKLSHPGLIHYLFTGSHGSMLLNYDVNSKKWEFKNVNTQLRTYEDWYPIDHYNRRNYLFEYHKGFFTWFTWDSTANKIVDKNINFLNGLKGKNAEQGLEHILKRVVNSANSESANYKEGNLVYSIEFKIGFARRGTGEKIDFGSFEYNLGEKRHQGQLSEMDSLIIRINQRTRLFK